MNKKNNEDFPDIKDTEENYDDDYNEEPEENVETKKLDNTKKIAIVIIMAIALFFFYRLFFHKKPLEDIDKNVEINNQVPSVIDNNELKNNFENTLNDQNNNESLSPDFELPKLPEFSNIEVPNIKETEEKPKEEEKSDDSNDNNQDVINFPTINTPTNLNTLPELEEPTGRRRNREISIVAYSGGANTNEEEKKDDKNPANLLSQINNGFNESADINENTTIGKSTFPRVAATSYGNKRYMLLQGKVLDAVLETAINTDDISASLQGVLRAVLTRDVYSEAGNNVLLPRGTRLIGVYTFTEGPGASKVSVLWTRAIRPDGYDIAINSPGIDQIGRNGLEGKVDTRLVAVIKNAILTSGITVGGGIISQQIAGEDGKVTTITDDKGNVKESGKLVDLALRDAMNNLTNIFKDYVTRNTKTNSVVYVDQGTPLKVFVNSDLIFSRSISGLVRSIDKYDR